MKSFLLLMQDKAVEIENAKLKARRSSHKRKQVVSHTCYKGYWASQLCGN
jgi:hypothetical protein